MEKAHRNFCSSCPREVTERAQMNSRKSIVAIVKRWWGECKRGEALELDDIRYVGIEL